MGVHCKILPTFLHVRNCFNEILGWKRQKNKNKKPPNPCRFAFRIKTYGVYKVHSKGVRGPQDLAHCCCHYYGNILRNTGGSKGNKTPLPLPGEKQRNTFRAPWGIALTQLLRRQEAAGSQGKDGWPSAWRTGGMVQSHEKQILKEAWRVRSWSRGTKGTGRCWAVKWNGIPFQVAGLRAVLPQTFPGDFSYILPTWRSDIPFHLLL